MDTIVVHENVIANEINFQRNGVIKFKSMN